VIAFAARAVEKDVGKIFELAGKPRCFTRHNLYNLSSARLPTHNGARSWWVEG